METLTQFLVFNLDGSIFTPSIVNKFEDKMLIYSSIEEKLFEYVKTQRIRKGEDFFLCPCLTPDSLLTYYPDTLILCGDSDPVLDSNLRFGLKLKMKNRDVRIKTYKYMQHGFLAYANFDFGEVYKSLEDILGFLDWGEIDN